MHHAQLSLEGWFIARGSDGCGDAGDAVGVLHLMDLPRNLRRRHAQEIKSLNALVEREMERLDMLARMAPLRREMAKVGPNSDGKMLDRCYTC